MVVTTSPQKKEHTALRSGDGSLVPRTGDDRSRQTLHGWIDAPPSFPASRSASSPPSTSTADQPETTSAPGTETPHPSGQTTPTSATPTSLLAPPTPCVRNPRFYMIANSIADSSSCRTATYITSGIRNAATPMDGPQRQHAGYPENIMLGAMLVDKVALEAQPGLCHTH